MCSLTINRGDNIKKIKNFVVTLLKLLNLNAYFEGDCENRRT